MDDTRDQRPMPQREEPPTGRLSASDPPPAEGGARPSVFLIVAIALAVIAIVALHLTGVLGPGAH